MTLFEIAARLDTSALARPGTPTKALVVANFAESRFSGVAVLPVDYSTRTPQLSIRLYTPDGQPVPCRVARESLGEPDEDGRRRWRFDLEFFCDLPPRTAMAYAAVFADGVLEEASEEAWAARLAFGEPLRATETECHAGDLPNPLSLRA
jgi:hypothetical protein